MTGARGGVVKLYLAGPMSGLPDFNFPAFHAAAARLRALGHDVVNPAENDHGDTSKPWSHYMRQDIAHVLAVDALAMLPGWRASRGATLEVTVARALDVPVLDAGTLEPVVESVLEEASRITAGDRQQAYGHPLDDFTMTAALLNARFAGKLAAGERFVAEDVPTIQRMVKESRLARTPQHRDSIVDIAGYARTQEMCWDERARRQPASGSADQR